MKVNDWLSETTKKLDRAGIGTARLDALVLLEDGTGKDRVYLLAHPDIVVQGLSLYKLNDKVGRRAKHEPLAYIRGETEFYGREFTINKHVLEPRPESETMIDLLKSLYKDTPCTVVDVGTGSGALAVTAKLELPKTDVIATEIDPKCLKVARQNATVHKTDIKFVQTDLLNSIVLPKNSILLCNLPYVPDDFTINQAAMNEPKIAIFGGPDGLDLYRRLFEQINGMQNKPKYILAESLPHQHKKLESVAKKSDYKLLRTDDFIQVFSK